MVQAPLCGGLAPALATACLSLTAAAALVVSLWWCCRRRRRHRAVAAAARKLVVQVPPPASSAQVPSPTRGAPAPLRERLTAVLTTSPVGRHPSTDLLDEVLGSLQLAEGVTGCDMIIVCDGYRSTAADGSEHAAPRYRSGIVDAASAANYEAYKACLRGRERPAEGAVGGLRVLELDSRHGFGFAVKAALELVRTPYVIVLQHDRPFIRRADIPRVVAAMEADPQRLKYMGMPTGTTLGHAYHVLSKYRLTVEPLCVDSGGLQAVPLVQWYDSAHICEVEHYLVRLRVAQRSAARGARRLHRGQAGAGSARGDPRAGRRGRAPGIRHVHRRRAGLRGEPCVGHLDGRDARNGQKFRFARPAVPTLQLPAPPCWGEGAGPPPDAAAGAGARHHRGLPRGRPPRGSA
ncbi:unnamed protein product [Prorocentrum cordatum]|uniref:Uncharacterized protein n=1 Tax=Prorocentrum cordatum TaxID=2364126 RepID=A0ABN9X6I0_9DINO|nr:unnamed protein product [Polarella glacialis]